MSIGLPVFNGEKYIRIMIESLLAQSYKNIEIIITDNASTDHTSSICCEYAKRDDRIKFYQNEENIGAKNNFIKVFELARGQFFMWAAHDDKFENTFVMECLSKLQENPEAILCVTDVKLIDEDNVEISRNNEQITKITTIGKEVVEIVKEWMSGPLAAYEFYGLFRLDKLKQISFYSDFDKLGGDLIFLFRVILSGDVLNIPKKLFCYRKYRTEVKNLDTYIRIFSNNDVSRQRLMKITPYSDICRNLLLIAKECIVGEAQFNEIRTALIHALTRSDNWIVGKLLTEHDIPSGNFVQSADLEEFISQLLQSEPHRKIGMISYRLGQIIEINRPLYIWGAGVNGSLMQKQYAEENVEVSGFIDSDPSKWGVTMNGVPIYPPTFLTEVTVQRPFIIISSIFASDISCHLNSMGYKQNNDYLTRIL